MSIAALVGLAEWAGAVGEGELASHEAEALIREGVTTASVFRKDGLSGGAAVRLGRPGGGKEPALDEAATLTLTVTKPEKAEAVLWARVLATNNGSDSLWCGVNGGERQGVSLKAGEKWNWQVLARSRVRTSETVFRIYPRESGCCLDRLVVAGSLLSVPSGMSGALVTQAPDLKSPYPLPPILPPGEHPRVFLRPEHLPMLRARLEHPFLAQEYRELRITADREWDGVFPTPANALKGNYQDRLLSIIEANALLGLLEEDEARGQRAVTMLSRALDTVMVADRHDVTRDYGRIILCASLVYDWCYSLTDKGWREAVLQHMIAFAMITEIGFPPKGQGAVTGHGSEAQLMREQLAAGIAVYDEYPEWYLFGAGRFFAEYVPARDMYFQAHRQHQGDSYGWSRFRWSMYATFLFDRLGNGPVFDKAQGQIPYSWIYMRRGDGQFLRDGDTFSRGQFWMFPQGAMMVASYYRDPVVNFAFRRMKRYRPNCISPLWMVLLYDPTVPERDISTLPLSRYFPSPAGDVIARTGWELGSWSGAVVAEMKGAFYHFNNHDHLDAGAFQVYYKGALATDAGSYGKYGTPYDWNWNKRSISHNTLLIYDPEKKQDATHHDGGQNYVRGRREPRVIEQVMEYHRDGAVLAHSMGPDSQTPFYTFLRADLTTAYADRAARVERSSVFLNLRAREVPAAMLVFDRVVAKKPSYRNVWLIHSVHEPAVKENSFDIRRTDGECNGRLLGTLLLPRAANRRIETIGGPGRHAEVFGHRFEPDRPTLESQGWRLEVSPRAAAPEQRFLNAMQVMDAVPEQRPLPVTSIVSPPFIGARIGDAVVLFPEGGGQVSSRVEVATDSAGQADWVVTGLTPGAWRVRDRAGVVIGSGSVGEGETVLCFRAGGEGVVLEPTARALGDLPLPTAERRNESGVVAVLDGMPIPTIPPLAVSGTCTRVALKPLAEALGYRTEGTGAGIQVTIDDDRLTVRPGEREAVVNGRPLRLTQPTAAIGGVLHVALPDLPALLHCRYHLDPLTDVLRIESPSPEFWWLSVVSASESEKGREANRASDGNPQSYWAASGTGTWLQVDLGRIRPVAAIDIAWLHGEKRKALFELQISQDGLTWERIFNGESSGTANGFETFRFSPTSARYTRVVGHGNSANAWNSICELRVRKR